MSDTQSPGASAGREELAKHEPSYRENQWRHDVVNTHLGDSTRLGFALCLIGEIDSRNAALRSALAAERAAGAANATDAARTGAEQRLAELLAVLRDVIHENARGHESGEYFCVDWSAWMLIRRLVFMNELTAARALAADPEPRHE